jgi:hypothetical protein
MPAAAARARGGRTLGSRMLYPGRSGISFAKVILSSRCVSGRVATESVAASRVARPQRAVASGRVAEKRTRGESDFATTL